LFVDRSVQLATLAAPASSLLRPANSRGRRIDELRRRYRRRCAPSGHIHRPHFQARKARRPAGRAVEQVRVRHKRQTARTLGLVAAWAVTSGYCVQGRRSRSARASPSIGTDHACPFLGSAPPGMGDCPLSVVGLNPDRALGLRPTASHCRPQDARTQSSGLPWITPFDGHLADRGLGWGYE